MLGGSPELGSNPARSSQNPLVEQPIRKPDQQPRTAWKYRKPPGGDATQPGFGRAFSMVAAPAQQASAWPHHG
jgi:hypothetical protein